MWAFSLTVPVVGGGRRRKSYYTGVRRGEGLSSGKGHACVCVCTKRGMGEEDRVHTCTSRIFHVRLCGSYTYTSTFPEEDC